MPGERDLTHVIVTRCHAQPTNELSHDRRNRKEHTRPGETGGRMGASVGEVGVKSAHLTTTREKTLHSPVWDSHWQVCHVSQQIYLLITTTSRCSETESEEANNTRHVSRGSWTHG